MAFYLHGCLFGVLWIKRYFVLKRVHGMCLDVQFDRIMIVKVLDRMFSLNSSEKVKFLVLILSDTIFGHVCTV